ncbi:MAG: ribosome small subunit-dependent GTPase A [Chloroflexi bacterium]|nr:ribosome small subunit-dependent GTPase A [Chloroflexota bacterium]MXX51045.1 ribosome small subunit-dependent GTPase A [Chloroflexota bacterium]MXX82853.1 ribosome small subunit-dependent GTPase A [Chloroflexota bacterium]MYA93595.1 ribosome small subunit-dependent GTPase A [Chloroflexota bacterium]MYC56139.1 ribosome small subunit-dependent GTPase A [Chloroflexota bacterium]
MIKEQSGFYWVAANDQQTYMCQLRGRLKEAAKTSDIAAIGDRVTISLRREEGTDMLMGTIEQVAPRKSALSRALRTTGKRGAGKAEREHVLIANADRALFVFAAAQPAPDLKMLDRLLVAGEKSSIGALLILLNKVDLGIPPALETILARYERLGYHILRTSALHGDGIEELRALLSSGISVFTGPSGVGKTSLLNSLQPGLGRQVKAVGGASQEGVHTTRDSALVPLGGGYLADTPGIRSLAPWDIEPDELDAYFVDIARFVLGCKFSNCTHIDEPACAVREALRNGEIARHRYKHYLELREELRDTYIIYNR